MPDPKVMLEMCQSQAARAEAELRDRFAMAALTGLIANHTIDEKRSTYADWSYHFADAMMEARTKKQTGKQ
jgi:hypothetical protein